jgi:D-alanyl-lipoteichoic acid acyltransferase DltB (MBOAT superfamily)
MEQFIQHIPYDYLGKRTIGLDNDKLVINTKNLLQAISDDYSYDKIDPEFKTIRRGEKEWGNIVYGLIVFAVVLFLLLKVFNNMTFKVVVLCLQLCTIAAATYLLSLGYFKRNFIYVLDTSGNCILLLKETDKSIAFTKKLKEKIVGSTDE